MNSMEEFTVFVLRKEGLPKHVTNGEPVDLADGFLFSIRPHSESWNDTERCAVMTGLSCLGSFGFSGYIAQKALADGAQIDSGTVALGLVALAATAAIAVGSAFACMKGIRAVGRHLCLRKAIRAR